MMNVTDKRHWYDGWIYDNLLAPNQKISFQKIIDLIPGGSSVVDIGCGTGRLAFRLAEKCRSVLAIDLSEMNIRTAKKNLETKLLDNVKFIHTDLESLTSEGGTIYDYSILSYILHEVSINERIKILTEAASISKNIIVSDHFPDASISAKIIREILEMGAGKQHYLSFRSFIKNDGINKLAASCNLRIVHEEVHRSHLHIAVLQK